MKKCELFLVKRHKAFENVFERMYVKDISTTDMTFVKRVGAMGYEFLYVETEYKLERENEAQGGYKIKCDVKERIIPAIDVLCGKEHLEDIKPRVCDQQKGG